MEALLDIYRKTLDLLLTKYGPVFVLLVLAIGFLFSRYERAHKKIVQAKDQEIERLVKERNWYQEQMLKKRLSSRKNATELTANKDDHHG